MRVDSYNAEARVPKVGTLWVWEPRKDAHCDLVQVIEVKWNGEEWYVLTERWPKRVPDGIALVGRDRYWNDAGRFAEAASPVVESGPAPTRMLWPASGRPRALPGREVTATIEEGPRTVVMIDGREVGG